MPLDIRVSDCNSIVCPSLPLWNLNSGLTTLFSNLILVEVILLGPKLGCKDFVLSTTFWNVFVEKPTAVAFCVSVVLADTSAIDVSLLKSLLSSKEYRETICS